LNPSLFFVAAFAHARHASSSHPSPLLAIARHVANRAHARVRPAHAPHARGARAALDRVTAACDVSWKHHEHRAMSARVAAGVGASRDVEAPDALGVALRVERARELGARSSASRASRIVAADRRATRARDAQ
jgi:uncharacterized protein YhdP